MKKVLMGLMVGLMAVGTMAASLGEDGHALVAQGKYKEAQAKFEQRVIDAKDNPNQTAGAVAMLYVGICQMRQHQYKAADESFVKTLSDYPKAEANILAQAMYYHAGMLLAQNEVADANDAYIACATDYVQALGAKDETSIVWRAVNKINRNLISVNDMKSVLRNIIKNTKAIEDNAKFIGFLLDELNKLEK